MCEQARFRAGNRVNTVTLALVGGVHIDAAKRFVMNSSIRLGAFLLSLAAAGAGLAYTDPPAKTQSAGDQTTVRWERTDSTAAARTGRVEPAVAAKAADTKAADTKAGAPDAARWDRTKSRTAARKGSAANSAAAAKTAKK
jgi:hypothetical protein